MDALSEVLTKPSSKADQGPPRCLEVSERGIKTSQEFALFMSHVISDIISGRLDPKTGSAAVNAGSKLLKVVEMSYKFGKPGSNPGERMLQLVDDK